MQTDLDASTQTSKPDNANYMQCAHTLATDVMNISQALVN